MPVFIDYHQLEAGLTIDDVRKAHRSDLEKQVKYGVKFLQYWVNERDSMVFCLIDGPNAESCVNCHLESHGNTPCNIQEVEPGIVEMIMGENLQVDKYHLTLDSNGAADPACRIVMVIQLGHFDSTTASKEKSSDLLNQAKSDLIKSIGSNGGRLVELTLDFRTEFHGLLR